MRSSRLSQKILIYCKKPELKHFFKYYLLIGNDYIATFYIIYILIECIGIVNADFIST